MTKKKTYKEKWALAKITGDLSGEHRSVKDKQPQIPKCVICGELALYDSRYCRICRSRIKTKKAIEDVCPNRRKERRGIMQTIKGMCLVDYHRNGSGESFYTVLFKHKGQMTLGIVFDEQCAVISLSEEVPGMIDSKKHWDAHYFEKQLREIIREYEQD